MRWILILWLGLATTAFAQTSPEEQRAREIGAQLRCVVCQNQSIEESDAQLAQDMRLVVREQIAGGASDEAVIAYIRESYGDYVLLKPPVQSNTFVLWFLPALLVLGSGFWFITHTRRRIIPENEITFSEDDKTLLDKLMSEDI